MHWCMCCGYDNSATLLLSCAFSVVPWNFHQPYFAAESSTNFGGDADLNNFLNLAKANGLYVLIRPGKLLSGPSTFGS